MDPLTVLVSALRAGAVAGVTETAAQAIKDTYAALKVRLAQRLGAQSEAVQALVAVEKKPDSAGRQATLKEELAAAGAQRDAELLRLAQALLDAAARTAPGASAHDHSVAVQGSGNVVANAGSIAVGGSVGGDVVLGPQGSGPQTNVGGDVRGPLLSGTFLGPVTVGGGETAAPAAADAPRERRLHGLLTVLQERLGTTDLRRFCLALGVDYEQLPGEEKGSRLLALLQYLDQRRRLPELLARGPELRPDIDWAALAREVAE